MRATPYRFLLLSIVPAAVIASFAMTGCGGRTGSDDDFGGESFADSSIDGSFDGSFDGTIDATIDGTTDGGSDVIRVDARDGSVDVIRFDSGPDGIAVDVIGIDVIEIDTAPDVIEIDTTPDVIEFDSGIEVGFDTGIDGGPIDGGIHCGPTGVDCDPATQECCAMFGGSFSCVAKGTCGGFPLSCSSAASCPTGDVCCLEFGGGGTGSASCTPGFCPGIQLCATSAECPTGTRCRRLFGGYRSCR
jgi:hypothetical protein